MIRFYQNQLDPQIFYFSFTPWDQHKCDVFLYFKFKRWMHVNELYNFDENKKFYRFISFPNLEKLLMDIISVS